MRNAFLKDSLRQVGVTINRFIAILSVTMLGVAFFGGLKATAPDMRVTAQGYFEKLNFMDVSLLSTAGFTNDDVGAIKAVKGVKSVMPAYSADALVSLAKSSLTVKLMSLDLDAAKSGSSAVINRPELTSGRLPENAREILADPRFLKLSGYKVGDRVTFSSGTGDNILSTLKRDTFTIVGVANDPLYISYERGSSTIGGGRVDAYFILPSSAFSLGVYTDVYITVKNQGGLSRFDSGYDDLISPVTAALDKLSGSREEIRYGTLKTEGQKKIDDAKAQLAGGEKALSDAQAQMDSAAAQIAGSEAQLAAAQTQYDTGEAEYQKNLASYNTNAAALGKAEEQLASAMQAAGVAGMSADEIQGALGTFETQAAALPQGDTRLPVLQTQIAGLQTILQTQTQLSGESTALAQGKAQLDAAAAALAASRQQLDDGYAKLDDAKAKLAQGQRDYDTQKADAQPKLDEAAKSIADGEKQLAQLKKPVWYVLDHNTNAGFVGFKQDADRIAAIANVFPLIFFLVAALVSLTTMTRLVEDDRTYIGTMKALGYGRGVIAAKYLIYALSASLLGSVLGVLVGFNLFPRVVFNAYGILYTLPSVIAQFNVPYAAVSSAAAMLCAALPAFFVCVSSLRSHPAGLMRPKVPQAGQRILLERAKPLWKHLNFSQKVAARNLFRYKKRLIMTIVGVAGCTALIFTGFGLRDSISTIVGKQYDEIRTYDMEVDIRENAPAADLASLNSALAGQTKGVVRIRQQSVDALKGGEVKSVYLVVPEASGKLGGCINLRKRVGGAPLKLGDDSVIVTEKLASLYSLRVGGTLKLRTSDGAVRNVKIGGICENYLFHYVYMSPALYQKTFGTSFTANQLLCRLPNRSQGTESAVARSLMKMNAVSSVAFTTNLKSNFQKMIVALRYVVLVLILSAAALAFVVLFSLTSINIDERGRELATIKVLGFYNSELAAYIYRENVILTVLSSLIGLVLGIFMQRFVIITAEVDLVMFSRDILWTTYLYAAGLTIVFAALVNAIMYGRFRKIDMVSSLKSTE